MTSECDFANDDCTEDGETAICSGGRILCKFHENELDNLEPEFSDDGSGR